MILVDKAKAFYAKAKAYLTHAASAAGAVVLTLDVAGINSYVPSFLQGTAAKVVSGALFAVIFVRELIKSNAAPK